MWSLGVAMFAMLVGYPPFVKAKTEEELFDLINTNNYDYNEQDWMKITNDAKKMIDQLIQPNVLRRLNAD